MIINYILALAVFTFSGISAYQETSDDVPYNYACGCGKGKDGTNKPTPPQKN